MGRKYLEAVALSDEGTDSDQVSLVEWKRFAANYSARNDCDAGMSAFRFPVSTSELCVRMAGALKREVQIGTIVESVQRSSRVRLGLSYGLSGVFDEVVLAVPPSCLGRIKFDGARSWDGIAMTPTCKLALLFDRAFWEDEGWSGHLMSDLAVQQVWPCGRALVCYVNGRAAEALAAQMDPVGFALASLSQAVPLTREHFVEGKLFDWSREEFSGGGFPYVPPDAKRQAPPPSGPVRFAGDWTADWIGFIEGALESAERVANEFKDEHGLS